MKKNIKEYIKNLRKEINIHSHEYYNLNNSKISDYDFDCKMKILEELERIYPDFNINKSPSKIIGCKDYKFISTVYHRYKMYSLNNSYNYNELINWNNNIKNKLKKK